ncbi:hypothetical protein FGG79_15740 [Bacillus sp. BHET2]|uniref:hypothetical protein n=1 Tax=Bacillus sp. BHET2 TaxID=2583818 RepID=UPI00110EAD77|nr:hypothetical protein [Bacillus sp. BHET2]TMU84343.1 hypothetical protein FGG79_15740 [Bacillus sp. BHET2]
MTVLLDARTSQNASFANSINVPLGDAPELIGIVGLNTGEATGPVTTQFAGTVSLQIPGGLPDEAAGITITVVRGLDIVADPIVYSATETYSLNLEPDERQVVITFEGSDYNVVSEELLIYTVFVNNPPFLPGGDVLIRVGPESFNAAVYDYS